MDEEARELDALGLVGVGERADHAACMPDSPSFETYACTLSYNGEPFNGFAKQPGQPTVQGDLERALATVFRTEVPLTCAGRTDSGVHAVGQVVSFDLAPGLMEAKGEGAFLRSMNALTADGISVLSLARKAAGFSARFDARSREYRYFICDRLAAPQLTAPFAWHIKRPLDADAMHEASRALIGEHDFKSFCMAASAAGKPTCRNVEEISFERMSVMGEELLQITIVGNAFLHSMVRAIVGTLAIVGRGKRASGWVQQVLDARERRAAGENAPARGLVLWRVNY